MTKKAYKKIRPYLYLIPVVFLFALGVLWRTTSKTTEVSAAPACENSSETGMIDPTARIGYWDGEAVNVPNEYLAQGEGTSPVLGMADPQERWIEVDLSEQKLKAWDGNTIFLETAISSGLPGTPTPIGEFRVWMKIRATRMEGGEGKYYYNLPNVPYVMFFSNDKIAPYLGYGLHGTYWHNDFGRTHSHGCVNLPTPIAKALYEWTGPVLAEGQTIVRSSSENPGTRIVIHE